MPERLTDEQWDELLRLERDAFKLTIRGFAALEAEIDAGCDRLFVQPIEGGAKTIGSLAKRIAVASALGVIPAEALPLVRFLLRLRHNFAHGDAFDLTGAQANELRRLLFPAPSPETLRHLDLQPARETLALALVVVRAGIQGSTEAIVRERDEAMHGLMVRRAIEARLAEMRGDRAD
jgi:hypothetical protein